MSFWPFLLQVIEIIKAVFHFDFQPVMFIVQAELEQRWRNHEDSIKAAFGENEARPNARSSEVIAEGPMSPPSVSVR